MALRPSRRSVSAAASELKSLQWEQIRRERFNITPEGLFKELVANAESLISRRAAEERRRLEWLSEAEALHDHVDEQDVPVAPSRGDKYGCDPDRFKHKAGRKPRGFLKAVGIADVIIIDEMRTALC